MALAVLVSVVAHAALWWLVKDALLLPKEPKNVSAPQLVGETVEFSIAPPSPDLGRGSREARGEGRTVTTPSQPKAPTDALEAAENGAAPTAAPSSVVEVELGGPHPDPLPQAGEGAPSGSTPVAASAAIDDAALVHARLADAARRCYPPAARRFRQQGTVTVSFCADDSGGVIDATIKATSGASLLDAAALGCVLPAATPLPPEAASRCYAVPVDFKLQ